MTSISYWLVMHSVMHSVVRTSQNTTLLSGDFIKVARRPETVKRKINCSRDLLVFVFCSSFSYFYRLYNWNEKDWCVLWTLLSSLLNLAIFPTMFFITIYFAWHSRLAIKEVVYFHPVNFSSHISPHCMGPCFFYINPHFLQPPFSFRPLGQRWNIFA